jgi:hypothetical protein
MYRFVPVEDLSYTLNDLLSALLFMEVRRTPF